MRILQAHKYHHLLGGAEKYYLELSEFLADKGHEVANYSMEGSKNSESKWEKYFVSRVSFKDIGLFGLPKVLGRMFYSFEARKKMGKLLDDFKPDIVHIQNIYYHISPSILPEIKKRGIPVVYTVHDYHLMTPNITFFHDGGVCEITRGGKIYKALFHKCVKGSYMATFPATLALMLQRLLGLYDKNIDIYIAPSRFMKDKLVENGFSEEKIINVPNFINAKDYKVNYPAEKSYVLYFGMLYEHKGVEDILAVAKRLPHIDFKIVGSGPEKENLEKKKKVKKLSNVEFLGRIEGKKLQEVIGDAYFCLSPSLWFENLPYSVLESFASGKPVVASRIGGIPEIIGDKGNGLLFDPGDVEELTKKISLLWEDKKLTKKLGKNARETALKSFSPDEHYESLVSIYNRLVK